MNARPIGVTILVAVAFAAAALHAALLVLWMTDQTMVRTVLGRLSTLGPGPSVLLGLPGMAPAYFLVVALVATAVGVGLWNLSSWARTTTLVMASVAVVAHAGYMIITLSPFRGFAFVITLVRLAIAMLALWYFSTQDVRTAFLKSRATAH